jgi:hypothetical protein
VSISFPITFPGTFTDDDSGGPENLAAVLERTREVTTELRRMRKATKLARTQISIYKNDPDGAPGLIFQGTLNTRECTSHEFRQRDNIAAPGNFEVRAGHYLAKFIATVPNNEDECKNIIIRVDRYGGQWRWTGLMKNWATETRDGVDYLKANFVDDLQFLTYMLGPPNPLMPIPVFQFPRDFFGWAPLRWLISTFIHMQIVRLEGHPFTLPDDPFDLEQYTDIIHPGRWQVQMKGVPLLQDSSLWGPIGSRMNTVDSVIADALEDAQLSIVYRRIFSAEGELADGLLDNDVANGQLVLDIVDRSGFSSGQATGLGTFFSGDIIGGAARSVVQYASGYIEDSLAAINDDATMYPDEYWQNSWMATLAAAPGHCLHDSHWHDLQAQDTHSPATAVRAVIGGDNPTVDAIAQLIIQSAGNLIGYFLLGGFDSLKPWRHRIRHHHAVPGGHDPGVGRMAELFPHNQSRVGAPARGVPGGGRTERVVDGRDGSDAGRVQIDRRRNQPHHRRRRQLVVHPRTARVDRRPDHVGVGAAGPPVRDFADVHQPDQRNVAARAAGQGRGIPHRYRREQGRSVLR